MKTDEMWELDQIEDTIAVRAIQLYLAESETEKHGYLNECLDNYASESCSFPFGVFKGANIYADAIMFDHMARGNPSGAGTLYVCYALAALSYGDYPEELQPLMDKLSDLFRAFNRRQMDGKIESLLNNGLRPYGIGLGAFGDIWELMVYRKGREYKPRRKSRLSVVNQARLKSHSKDIQDVNSEFCNDWLKHSQLGTVYRTLLSEDAYKLLYGDKMPVESTIFEVSEDVRARAALTTLLGSVSFKDSKCVITGVDIAKLKQDKWFADLFNSLCELRDDTVELVRRSLNAAGGYISDSSIRQVAAKINASVTPGFESDNYLYQNAPDLSQVVFALGLDRDLEKSVKNLITDNYKSGWGGVLSDEDIESALRISRVENTVRTFAEGLRTRIFEAANSDLKEIYFKAAKKAEEKGKELVLAEAKIDSLKMKADAQREHNSELTERLSAAESEITRLRDNETAVLKRESEMASIESAYKLRIEELTASLSEINDKIRDIKAERDEIANEYAEMLNALSDNERGQVTDALTENIEISCTYRLKSVLNGRKLVIIGGWESWAARMREALNGVRAKVVVCTDYGKDDIMQGDVAVIQSSHIRHTIQDSVQARCAGTGAEFLYCGLINPNSFINYVIKRLGAK